MERRWAASSAKRTRMSGLNKIYEQQAKRQKLIEGSWQSSSQHYAATTTPPPLPVTASTPAPASPDTPRLAEGPAKPGPVSSALIVQPAPASALAPPPKPLPPPPLSPLLLSSPSLSSLSSSPSPSSPSSSPLVATATSEPPPPVPRPPPSRTSTSNRQRIYPAPTFEIPPHLSTRTPRGGRSSYQISFKLKVVAYSKVICADGKVVGNRGAAAVLGLPVKRIREWCKDEKGMREALSNGSVTHDAKSMGGGSRPSTASVEQELVEYVNELTNLGLEVGRDMILSKLLSLEPKALGGMPPASDLSGVEKFQAKFRQWLRRFKVRHKATLAKLSSADQ